MLLEDGTVVSAGPPTLLAGLYNTELVEAEPVPSIEPLLEEGQNRVAVNVSSPSKAKKLVLEEERAVGRVPKTMVFGYIKQMGGPFLVALLIASCIFLELVSLGNTFFVGMWSGRFLCLVQIKT